MNKTSRFAIRPVLNHEFTHPESLVSQKCNNAQDFSRKVFPGSVGGGPSGKQRGKAIAKACSNGT
jgi:hypothetical protein